MKFLTLAVLAVSILAANGLPAMSGHTPVQKGNRILAIDINPPENGDYNAVFKLSKDIGVQDVGLSLDWKDLETATGKYDPTWLAVANVYYPPNKVTVSLTIRPIHVHRKVVPDDLMKMPLNDPEMISRFNKLIDFALEKMPDVQISSLVVGSEIDIYLGKDDKLWKEYEEFFTAVKAHAKKKRPGLKVGTEAKLEGLTDGSKKQLLSLNKHADFVGVSYYPLENDFSVKNPSVVKKDFKALVSVYPKSKMRFFQYGYPSSSKLKSSEEKQKQFIKQTFEVWDQYASQIEMIDFTWLHDIPKAALDVHAKYYGSSDARFLAFLETLGLRTYPIAGTDKEALKTLKYEAKARGW